MSGTQTPVVSNWNLPNVLTGLRIVMVPFFAWALLIDGGDSITWRCVAFVIFVVAMITDKIDGDLARKHNLITNFGKIADPIADKAITGMAFVGLSVIGALWWWVTVLVLVRVISVPDRFFPFDGRGLGIWIALIAALGLIVGGLLRAGEEL